MARGFASTVFALALIGSAGMALAQSQPAAPPASAQAVGETPQQNVRASQQYQQLTCSNPKFRATRIAKECGPLQGSQFYDSCVASFNCDKQPSDANWNKAPPSETIK
ncbi:MAG: hypothetical protein WB697_20925 [Stellaceae bacterium]